MNKYYYHFPADSKEGRALRSFHRACQKADQEAGRYAKKVGAVAYYGDQEAFAGGVACLLFSNPKTVNANIWRFIGERDGEPLYMPNVNDEPGKMLLQDGQAVPKNTAHRIYGRKQLTDDKGQRWVTYLDVKPVAEHAPKADRTRAVTAEVWRLNLPTVTVRSFYTAVGADTSGVADMKDDTVNETLPVFFCHRGRYYIGLDYPIDKPDFEVSHLGEFQAKKNDMLWEERQKKQKDV